MRRMDGCDVSQVMVGIWYVGYEEGGNTGVGKVGSVPRWLLQTCRRDVAKAGTAQPVS